jgi:hypothetical protein
LLLLLLQSSLLLSLALNEFGSSESFLVQRR